MSRWVDPRIQSVRVEDVRSYLMKRGWTNKPYARPELLAFEGPPDDSGKRSVQVLPSSEQASDYLARLVELITALSVMEDRYAFEVLNDILQQPAAYQRANPDGQNGTGRTQARGDIPRRRTKRDRPG
jgi:hypothetical protein